MSCDDKRETCSKSSRMADLSLELSLAGLILTEQLQDNFELREKGQNQIKPSKSIIYKDSDCLTCEKDECV